MKAIFNNVRVNATLALIFIGITAFGHSVQVAYCINCQGQLRLYVEHWHGTEDPNSTTMTIEYTVGGVTTSIVGSPEGSIQDVPFGQLPGCATPATSFGTCPGSANSYNDWVYYDFLNPPNGVAITIKVISGSNAFTMDCGSMYPAIATFTIPPIANVAENVPSQTTCNNSSFAPTTFTSAGVFDWSNDNTSIGLAANGTGNIPSFTAINTTSVVQTAVITFTNGCNTGTFQLTVNPGPNPNFSFPLSSSGNQSNYCKTNPITFSLANTPSTNPLWDFGDGVTSNAISPSHTYSNVGTYSVTVVVTGANTCTSSSTQTLSVYTPTPNFITSNNCVNTVSSFTNTSMSPQTIASYVWDFGDNSGIGSGNTTNYTYSISGTYNTTLTINTVDGCSASIAKPITIYPNPIISFTALPVCIGLTSTFTNSSSVNSPDNISTWAWDFQNNGSIDDVTQSPSFTYLASGIYSVALTATTNNGCIKTAVNTIKVNEKPTASFAPTAVCENAFVPMNNSSTISSPNTISLYSWDFGSGASSTTSSNQNPNNVFYSTYGVKTITLTITANTSCTATTTQTVLINPIPIPNFSFINKCINVQPNSFDASGSTISIGNITTYAWLFGDGNNNSNAITTTNNYAVAGLYNTTLTVTSDKNCVASISKQIEVYQKPLLTINSNTVCYKVAMSFSATPLSSSGSVVSWAWDFDSNASTTEGVGKNTIYNFPTEGTQLVSLTSVTDHGCSETYTNSVYVNYLPKPDFTVDDPDGCAEHCVVFSDLTPALTGPQTNTKWKWVYGDGSVNNSTNSNNKNHCYENPTTDQVKDYDVKLIVTSSVGCKDSINKSSYISVFPNPVASFTYVPEFGNVVQPQVNFINQSIDYTTWNWNFGDGTNEDSVKQNPIHNYDTESAKSYYTRLIVSNQYGCRDTAYAKVDISPDFAFYIPNAFSPLNEDGINDIFKGVGVGVVKYEMWVIDRWGATIFYSDEIAKGWNGKVQGQENVSKQEVYIWKVKLKDVLGKDREYVGHVTLLK